MPLPKIVTPQYTLDLPSTGKSIKYRPFLVKEEKILILALESEDVKQITSAIKQILKDCIITKGIKVEELPTFDIEYIFLNVRGHSVGEAIELIVTCSDDGTTEVPVKIYIDEIQVQKDPNHSTDINLGDGLVLRMKYPSLNEFIKNNFDFSSNDVSSIEKSFDIVSSCIDIVFNADESWAAADCTKKELNDWIETLTSQQFQEIEKFFNTMPKLAHTFKVTNPNTEKESEVTLEGLTSFFG
ncbi:MAG: hypothetical protein SCG72_02935 [Nitrosarchaeum sp.]|nr:hypothetical protein [Nitrosarchaeum sp.]